MFSRIPSFRTKDKFLSLLPIVHVALAAILNIRYIVQVCAFLFNFLSSLVKEDFQVLFLFESRALELA